ncbi:hypothetical protein TL16_g01170 [Triparma laevis f. inornata]|uniref:Endonuclease/exonuclease/phosphatase domain-containing protein n=1 Tax=Triparma laevis f. inornata TaxID=1714386 RepID=A0A9W6ZH48_9STRA|nr:hypothetical protein TL16_g01170 [Triparma laevis f. inornata]
MFFPNFPKSSATLFMATSPVALFVLIRASFALNIMNLPYHKTKNRPNLLSKSRLDFQGTAIAFNKRTFDNVKCVHIEGFGHEIRGYPKPRRLLVCNVHLVLGYPNPSRKLQIQRVLDAIRTVMKSRRVDGVVICGDFNAPKCDSAFRVLEGEGWIDLGGEYPKEGKEEATWVKGNELCDFEEEEFGEDTGEECRIDFCWVKSFDSQGIKWAECETIFNGNRKEIVSDHYGLKIKVKQGLGGNESPKGVNDFV